MNESQRELFEGQLLSIAKRLEYPRTPDITGVVMRSLREFPSPVGREARGEGRPRFISRRLIWSLTILLILGASLMLIPSARAAILEFIQIGAVRIFPAQPIPLDLSDQHFAPTAIPFTATPALTSPPLISMLENIAGEMTLAEAQQAVDYPILLPSYPPDLGKPDRVFVQEADGKMTVLVWVDPQQPDKVQMSLHFIPSGSWAIKKMEPQVIQETTVRGQHAIWAVGPYMMQFSNGKIDVIRLVDGHVLIWEEGDITYRLETSLSLEEAVKVAESLEPIR